MFYKQTCFMYDLTRIIQIPVRRDDQSWMLQQV
jgi:hypothetical protein